MDEISIVIVVLLALYAGFAQLDAISVQLGFYSPLFGGAIAGLLLGDLQTGLAVGGTMQLMTLGVATYGGASIPDYLSGSIMGTAFAILSGQGAEYGIALGIPIGLLLTQLDVFGRMANVIFQHRADRHAEKGNARGVETSNMLGMIPWTLTRIIPVFVGLYFGETIVTAINDWIPTWLMTGLRTAGGLMPALGIALLLRYLPVKKFYPFIIVGFVMMAYISGVSILAVSLIGLAMAAIYLMFKPQEKAAVAGAYGDDIEVDMEVEVDE